MKTSTELTRARVSRSMARIYSDMPTDPDLPQGDEAFEEEFALMNAMWADLEVLASDDEILAYADNGTSDSESRHWNWGRYAIAAGVILTVAFLSLGLVQEEPQVDRDRYVTRKGIQKQITLPEGSQIQINTDSELVAEYGSGGRAIQLIRGEVFVDVAKSAEIPFNLSVEGKVVTVLGTTFNVRMKESGFVLTVSEGQVVVHGGEDGDFSNAATLDVSGGRTSKVDSKSKLILNVTQRLTYLRESNAFLVSEVVGDSHMGWRKGILKFMGVPFSEVISELNRYSGVEIIIASPHLENMSVHALINVHDIDASLEMFKSMLPVTLERRMDKIIIREKKSTDQ